MSQFVRLFFISLLSVVFAGCASMPGSDVSHPSVSATTKGAALKGCGMGALAGAAVGLIKGGGVSSALKWGAGGCAVGGVTAGVVSYRAQLKEARALEADAKAQGLAPVVTTRDVTPADSKSSEPALERLVLPLDARNTAARGSQTQGLLEKAGHIAASDKTQPITVTVAGSAQDRAWMRSVLAPVSGSAVIVDRSAAMPSVELSPLPTVAPAAPPAHSFDARTGIWSTPAKGGH